MSAKTPSRHQGLRTVPTQPHVADARAGRGSRAKAQELASRSTRRTRFYQLDGGASRRCPTASGQMVEPLGASTMPQSVLPSPSASAPRRWTAPGVATTARRRPLDLDIGGGDDVPRFAPLPLRQPPPRPCHAGLRRQRRSSVAARPRRPFSPCAGGRVRPRRHLADPIRRRAAQTRCPALAARPGPNTVPSSFGDSGLSGFDEDDTAIRCRASSELAEEFRQIGDMKARATAAGSRVQGLGPLKSKAQGMLEQLGQEAPWALRRPPAAAGGLVRVAWASATAAAPTRAGRASPAATDRPGPGWRLAGAVPRCAGA